MSEKEKDSNWMQNLWRPAMGWMYMIICLADMLVFPVLWSLLQAMTHQPITQWNPLTLQGAGLFHIAMGAVLGIAAMGRTQEKLAGANNGGASTAPTGFSVPSSTPSGFSAPAQTGFGATGAAGGFGSSGFGGAPPAAPAGGFGSPAAKPAMSSTGKPMPIQPDQPAI